MKTKLYLDTRSVKSLDLPCPVKISLNSKGSSAYISTGISVLVSQWDKVRTEVIAHPLKARYNMSLLQKKLDVDKALEELRHSGELHGKKLSQIRKIVLQKLEADESDETEIPFMRCFDNFTATKKKYGTRITYEQTAKKIRNYDTDADTLSFADITKAWLVGFDAKMAETAPSYNARSIHLRNIRTVFNYALEEGYTEAPYPFHKYKIKSEQTKDRSISREELRKFFSAPCSPSQEEYRDIFKLSFLLCGINLADLARVETLTNGRIELLRAKTGQPISIAICAEAQEIIERYKGSKHLLSFADRYSNYRDYLHRLNSSLKTIGRIYNPQTKKWDGEALQPHISYYYARYSWATIAAEIDIPERTIGAALAHSTRHSVTAIYTRVDMRKKIDEANRKVIDTVFGKSK